MSREEAIKEIKEYRCVSTEYDTAFDIALDVAIEALEREQCGDCVNREEVIKQIFYSADNSCDVVLSTELMDRIKRLPSVSPMPKMGKWIKNAEEWQNIDPPYFCSECGNASLRKRPYCDSCGAKMEDAE